VRLLQFNELVGREVIRFRERAHSRVQV